MLELKDIILSSNTIELPQPLSLTAEAGKVTTVTGPAGSGKTWLLKAIMGLAPHESGYITINGEVVTPDSAPFFRKHIAYVPQDVTMPPMTISEIIGQLWTLHSNSNKEFHHADLRRQWQVLDLDSQLWETTTDNIPAPTLRRMLLSVTPYLKRPILLVDMPCLDQTAEHQSRIRTFLQQQAEGGTIVLITDRPY